MPNFNGTIDAVKQLVNLESLLLFGNNFTGSIAAVQGLSKLTQLNLGHNGFTGPLDPLAALGSLIFLNARKNSFTGPIGPLKELTSLKGLLLDRNKLTGKISVLKELTNLCCWTGGGGPALYLDSNRFTGPINAIYNLHHLTGLNLSNNSFSGTVGDGFSKQNMPNLTYIDLSVNDVTAVPSNLVDWTGFPGGCNLRQEAFTCSAATPIPIAAKTNCGASCACVGSSSTLTTAQCIAWQELFDSTNGREWTQCSDSRLDPCSCGGTSCDPTTGPQPRPLCVMCNNGDITAIKLDSNGLKGAISSSIGKLTGVTFLHLGVNQLTGIIPSALAELKGLARLLLHDNQLSGSIPSELGELNSLTFLRLWNNQLNGRIPSELAELKSLTYLYLYGNKLTGIVPPLPFEQYNGSCALDRPGYCTEPDCNHFKCPLPTNSDQCKDPPWGGVHCL
jgi:Leucine-rich repeat (LRR) protein